MARPREFDEPTVLRAAADVFRDAGYAGASVDALTAATGLGKGSLYGAYGSKQGLFVAALDAYRRGAVASTHRDLSGADTAIDDLRDYLVAMATGATGNSPNCMLTTATVERADHDAEVATRMHETFAELRAALGEKVRAAQAEGAIDRQADPDALADFLMVVARGMDVVGHASVSRERLLATADIALAAVRT